MEYWEQIDIAKNFRTSWMTGSPTTRTWKSLDGFLKIVIFGNFWAFPSHFQQIKISQRMPLEFLNSWLLYSVFSAWKTPTLATSGRPACPCSKMLHGNGKLYHDCLLFVFLPNHMFLKGLGLITVSQDSAVLLDLW